MPGWSKRQTKRKVKCPAGTNAKPKGKLNAPPGLPVDDDKKCKKKLSFDAVALSGGFFYPELRSTIVRMVWLSLSRIKSISQSPNRPAVGLLGTFMYAVPDARGRGLMAVQGLFILWRQFGARTSASNMEVNSCYHPLKIGLLS